VSTATDMSSDESVSSKFLLSFKVRLSRNQFEDLEAPFRQAKAGFREEIGRSHYLHVAMV